jgi:translation elongation factor EF-Tu-like GTPase
MIFMLFLGDSYDASLRYDRAKLYSNPSWEEFDLDRAISLLEEAAYLKPKKKQYTKRLNEMRKLKAKSQLKLTMQVQAVYGGLEIDTGEAGLFIYGKIEQGTVRRGDEVKIKGQHRVLFVESAKGYGIPGETTGLVIEGLTIDGIKRGDVIEGV